MKIGYARVSTRDQNAGFQIDALKKAGCERIYQDVASGSKSARPELDKLLVHVRPARRLESVGRHRGLTGRFSDQDQKQKHSGLKADLSG